MTHGDLIKKLRKERNMTQMQLAADISSRTTLSSFENNRSRVSSDLLFAYLERMNISIQEYLFYFNNNSSTEKERITQYFYDNVVKSTDREILNRIIDYRAKYNNSHDFYFCCLSIELKLFLNHKQDKNIFDVEEDITIVKKYLERVQQWGHFEMSLFSNCLYVFSNDYIRGTFSTLLKRTKIISKIDTYQNDIAIFLNNCIILSFERQQLQDTNFFVAQLYKLSADTPRKAYDRLMCNFYEELIKCLRGNQNNLSIPISRFEELGFVEHVAELKKFVSRISTIYNSKTA